MSKIVLKKVRVSFPKLFEAEEYEEGDGKPKFSATYILDPDDHAKSIREIEKVNDRVAKEKFHGKVPKGLKVWTLVDGDEKADPEEDKYMECAGKMLVSASRHKKDGRPYVIDRQKNPITAEDGVIYSGCYVNATIKIWAYDNKTGKGISSTLMGVQFHSDGEPIGSSDTADPDDFDEFDDDDEDGESMLD